MAEETTKEVTTEEKTMLGSMVASLSVLYALFLLSIFVVLLTTGLFVPKELLDSYHYDTEGVLAYLELYLGVGSIVFFVYLLLGLTRQSRSTLNETGHTSAFVRVGGFVFGMGSIAYLTLRVIEDISKPKCHPSFELKLGRFLSLIFTILQMVAVILCSRIKIDEGWGVPHFGCMHLVATNLVTWVLSVYKESEHVMHLAEDIKTCVKFGERSSNNGTSHHDDDHHRRRRAADENSDCAPLSATFEEIFYPFQIEFVLIGKLFFSSQNLTIYNRGGIAFVSTWRAIAKLREPEKEDGLVKPRPFLYLAGS